MNWFVYLALFASCNILYWAIDHWEQICSTIYKLCSYGVLLGLSGVIMYLWSDFHSLNNYICTLIVYIFSMQCLKMYSWVLLTFTAQDECRYQKRGTHSCSCSFPPSGAEVVCNQSSLTHFPVDGLPPNTSQLGCQVHQYYSRSFECCVPFKQPPAVSQQHDKPSLRSVIPRLNSWISQVICLQIFWAMALFVM